VGYFLAIYYNFTLKSLHFRLDESTKINYANTLFEFIYKHRRENYNELFKYFLLNLMNATIS
jgi:effector-binding domain-containing protein